MADPSSKYRLSFSFGGLFQTESIKTAQIYAESSDWRTVREQIEQNNDYQQKKSNSIAKMFREISGRLKTLSVSQLQLLVKL